VGRHRCGPRPRSRPVPSACKICTLLRACSRAKARAAAAWAWSLSTPVACPLGPARAESRSKIPAGPHPRSTALAPGGRPTRSSSAALWARRTASCWCSRCRSAGLLPSVYAPAGPSSPRGPAGLAVLVTDPPCGLLSGSPLPADRFTGRHRS
jgi:hypothetical protein